MPSKTIFVFCDGTGNDGALSVGEDGKMFALRARYLHSSVLLIPRCPRSCRAGSESRWNELTHCASDYRSLFY